MINRILGPKITIPHIRSYLEGSGVHDYEAVEKADLLNTILSRELPQERFNGVLSIILAFRNGASDEEMDDALVN